MLRITTKIIFTLVILISISGCSLFNKKNSRGRGQGSGTYSSSNGYGTAPSLTEENLGYEYESRYGDGSIPQGESGGVFRDVFFDYDSSKLSPEAKLDIQENASILMQKQNLIVQLEGHCDERGTDEYNLALGEYRARSVRETLLAMGISPQRIKTISYGEHIPIDNSGSELAFAKNRRVHFAVVSSR